MWDQTEEHEMITRWIIFSRTRDGYDSKPVMTCDNEDDATAQADWLQEQHPELIYWIITQ